MSETAVQVIDSIRSLSDDEVLRRLCALLKASRRVEAVLVAHIGEVDARKLYAREASPSMFSYCIDRLHLSDHEAYLRITVARASRQYPIALTMLAEGRIHLTAIAKLAPHLTADSAATLLDRATGLSKVEIEQLVASLAPAPEVRSGVRRLPQRPPSSVVEPRSIGPAISAPPLAPILRSPPAATLAPRPLAPDRYRIQFTADASFCSKLDRLKDLLCTSVPSGDVAAIIDRAVTELVGRLEARRFGLTSKPRVEGPESSRDTSRYIPMDVRREVFARDAGRCRFVGPGGERCPARRRLEFHHVEPFARGGRTTVANVQLMCRTHNAYLAERDFGAAHMDRFRKGREASRPPPAAPSRAG